MKVTTEELAQFLNADWARVIGIGTKEDWYYEGNTFEPLDQYINGENGQHHAIVKDQCVDLEELGLEIAWQGDGREDSRDFIDIMKKWRKQQKTAVLLIEIDKTKLDALQATVKKLGGKIVE